MSIFIDDYGIIDTAYLVHAVPMDGCPVHGADEFRIPYTLAVNGQAVAGMLIYPSRALRDDAFERLVACMKQWMAHSAQMDAEADEDDDEDTYAT